MNTLEKWEHKIKEKRKQSNFKDFLKEVASWKPFGFYKNDGVLSRYPRTQRVGKIVPTSKYNPDALGLLDYDFTVNFFENFRRLFTSVDLSAMISYGGNENCDFADCVFGVKNAYLSIVSGINSENVCYSAFCYVNVKNVFNSVLVTDNSENVYMSSLVTNSFNIFYSKNINNASNIWFSTNLIGCSECLFCDGLENQSYCIKNQKFPQETYLLEKEKMLKNKAEFTKYYRALNQNITSYGSENCTGKGLFFCHNVENGYFFKRLSGGRNVLIGTGGSGVEQYYDCIDVGSEGRDYYGVSSAGNGDNYYLSTEIGFSSHIYYSLHMDSCSFCIGCIGLRNKQFCILNKQYTKEEWYAVAEKIFSQMERDGILGDFFPGWLNPFYFNDTMAYIIDGSFSQEEIENDGFLWREDEIKVDIPQGMEVVNIAPPAHSSLPPQMRGAAGGYLASFQGYDTSGKWRLNPEILKKVIQDEKGNVYRIVVLEYDFLIKHGLPIPEMHWVERIKQGFDF